MEKVMRYISLLIIVGFFVLATFLLVGSYFSYLPQEVRVIFAIFLYLYGMLRLVRTFTKKRSREEEEEDSL